jgi:hypothetical protein
VLSVDGERTDSGLDSETLIAGLSDMGLQPSDIHGIMASARTGFPRGMTRPRSDRRVGEQQRRRRREGRGCPQASHRRSLSRISERIVQPEQFRCFPNRFHRATWVVRLFEVSTRAAAPTLAWLVQVRGCHRRGSGCAPSGRSEWCHLPRRLHHSCRVLAGVGYIRLTALNGPRGGVVTYRTSYQLPKEKAGTER